MATASKKETVESKIETTEESQQEEVQQDSISDRKVILAPLAKYGAVAVVIVGIIVTTAIMMNREFNEIDAQVAALEIEIAQQNQPKLQTEQEVTKTTAEPVETLANNDEATPVTTLAEVIQPVATEAAVSVSAPVSIPAQPVSRTLDAKTRIAKFHELMAQQDQKQLDTYKLNQARQIEMLRAQLTRQQERIEAIEKRNQESYAIREAAVKRMQHTREQSLNRI